MAPAWFASATALPPRTASAARAINVFFIMDSLVKE
jgi:hypothetical protein